MDIVNELIEIGPGGARNSGATSLEDPRLDLHDPATWDKITGGARAESGVRMTPQLALGQPAFWRGVGILAAGVAKIPFDVYKNLSNGTKDKDKKHFANPFLKRRVNSIVSVFTFKRTMTFHQVFRGNGVAVIKRDNAARPLAMFIVDPDRWGIVQQPDGSTKYLVGAGKDAKLIEPSDIFHLRGLSYDGLMGIDVYTLMTEALGLGVAARRFGTRFFGKGANAGGVLMTPAGLSEKAVDRLHKDFKKATTGLDNAFSVALLEEGCKWTQTTIAPEQAQFLETRKFEIREVANVLGLPSHMLGDKEGQAYNTLEMESQSFLDHSLDPLLCVWEDELNEKLLTEQQKNDGTHCIEANRLAAIRIDTITESETLIAQTNNGLLSPDEARNIRNRPAYPEDLGKRFRMPSNIMYADQDSAAETAAETKTEVASLVVDCLERLQKIEVDQLQKAAKRDGNFTAWCEDWYTAHGERIRNALAPVLRVAATIWKNKIPSAEVIGREWCDTSRAEVLALTECKAAELPASVEGLVRGWNGRCGQVAAKILGE